MINIPENKKIVYALCVGIRDNKVFKRKAYYDNGFWYSENNLILDGYCRVKFWKEEDFVPDLTLSEKDLYDNAIALKTHRKGSLIKDYLKELSNYLENNNLNKNKFLNLIENNSCYDEDIKFYIKNYFYFPKSILPNDFKV